MKLVQAVTAEIGKRSRACYLDLLPLFPHKTRTQVQDAIWNAKAAGLIAALPKTRSGHKGNTPTFYRALPEVNEEARIEDEPLPPRGDLAHIGRVNSVWALGA
jgi:hypothetical protein